MAGWRNFYLQKMGTDTNNQVWPVKESVAEWGVFCKTIPFVIAGKVKDPAKRSWNDEHGDDEYIPSDGLYLEGYTMTVEFGCKVLSGRDATTYGKSVSDVRTAVSNFLSYLRTSGMMKMYSSYTGIGRQEVRLESIKDNAKWKKEGGEQWLTFEVSFKVNDPVTDITLTTTTTTQNEQVGNIQ